MLLLLLLLLLSAGTKAQSGDREADMEPKIDCNSHFAEEECSVTCKLLGGSSDDEDEDVIEGMSLCYNDLSINGGFRCLQGRGDTISSKDLLPVMALNLTVHLKRGGDVSTKVDLREIVKPRSPEVWKVSFDQELNQAVIHYQTSDNKGYLTVENQVFQLHICTAGSNTIQNVSSKDFLLMDMGHLKKHTEYHVRVRAIPQNFQGSWSEWSKTFSFVTPAEKKLPDQTYKLIVCLVSLVVLTSSVVICWKNKIFTYMWPSIPHPKQTLVQICKPNKGLLLNFKPEVFSALRVYPLEKPACEEAEPSISPAASNPSSTPSSTQSSGCRSTTSVSTEELELSTLLGSSSGEDSLQSSSPSPVNVPQPMERPRSPAPDRISAGHEVEVFGVSQQEEAYVTMSSFYQIK